MPEVRTRFQPDRVLEVSDEDAKAMAAQGLLADVPEPPGAAPTDDGQPAGGNPETEEQ